MALILLYTVLRMSVFSKLILNFEDSPVNVIKNFVPALKGGSLHSSITLERNWWTSKSFLASTRCVSRFIFAYYLNLSFLKMRRMRRRSGFGLLVSVIFSSFTKDPNLSSGSRRGFDYECCCRCSLFPPCKNLRFCIGIRGDSSEQVDKVRIWVSIAVFGVCMKALGQFFSYLYSRGALLGLVTS